MEASLTEFKPINIPILTKTRSSPTQSTVPPEPNTSALLLDKIYETLNSPSSYRPPKNPHKNSISA